MNSELERRLSEKSSLALGWTAEEPIKDSMD